MRQFFRVSQDIYKTKNDFCNNREKPFSIVSLKLQSPMNSGRLKPSQVVEIKFNELNDLYCRL